MQRKVHDGVIIACDFCGTDWDQVKPMIEGHQGSVLCLSCLEQALANLWPSPAPIRCTLCLREQPAGTSHWRPPSPNPVANPAATVCRSCVEQAARTFDKDPDVDWKWPRR